MNTKPNEELRAIYRRCDVSNNGTVDPLGEDEFVQLIQTEIAEAERRAKQEAHKELFDAIRDVWSNPPKEFVEQGANEVHWHRDTLLETLDVLEYEWQQMQLTEIEVSHGKGLDPEPTITGKIDPIVGEEVKVEKPYKITENEYQEKQSE